MNTRIEKIEAIAITAIAFLAIFAMIGTASAENFTVNTTGWWNMSWSYNESSIPIQDAIDNATAGDTINVAAGTYEKKVTVDKEVILQGAGDTSVINPPPTLATNG